MSPTKDLSIQLASPHSWTATLRVKQTEAYHGTAEHVGHGLAEEVCITASQCGLWAVRNQSNERKEGRGCF